MYYFYFESYNNFLLQFYDILTLPYNQQDAIGGRHYYIVNTQNSNL